MSWTLARRLFVVAGAIYLWGLVPLTIRPRIPHSPFQKNTQTIVVDVDSPAETTVPWRAAGAVADGCHAPVLLRPFESDADSVRVLLRYREKIVTDTTIKCAGFGT